MLIGLKTNTDSTTVGLTSPKKYWYSLAISSPKIFLHGIQRRPLGTGNPCTH